MNDLRKRRMPLVFLAATSVVIIGALIALATSQRPARADGGTAPVWLQERASGLITEVCQEANPSSVTWMLTTAGQLATAMGDGGAAASSSNREVYVVVAHGRFIYTAAHVPTSTAALPTGETLVISFDAETQVGNGLYLLGPDTSIEQALGTMNPMVLTSVTE